MSPRTRPFIAVLLFLFALFAGGAVRRAQDTCGPFTDVSALFCPYVLEAYYTGITAGTSPTTFSPDIPITRGQSAVFTTKALNQALARGSRRGALGQWWTTQGGQTMGFTTIGGATFVAVQADGEDVWGLSASGTIERVHASDGRSLGTWTNVLGVQSRGQLVVAMGKVFATGFGHLYMVDPTQAPGSVTTVADTKTGSSTSLTFDGSRFWMTDSGGSLFIVTPGATVPWAVQTIAMPGMGPAQAIFDGANVWICDTPGVQILKMNADGSIALHVVFDEAPTTPTFDGANLWVPYGIGSIAVVRPSDGAIVSTLIGNGLSTPMAAAFDGQRVMVLNGNGNTVSLWNAASLQELGVFSTLPGGQPTGVCSDGINFWIAFQSQQLGRF